MKKLNLENFGSLVEPQYGQCISMYLDLQNHPIWSLSGMMRYRSLLRQAREKLENFHGKSAAKAMLNPIEYFPCLQSDVLRAKSIAFFSSRRVCGFFPMFESVESDVTIAGTFHIKPVISYLNPSESWYLLDVSKEKATLYKCQSRLMEKTREFEFSKSDSEKFSMKGASLVKLCVELYLKHSKAPLFVLADRTTLKVTRQNIGNVFFEIEKKYEGIVSQNIVQSQVWDEVSSHFEQNRKLLLGDVLDELKNDSALTNVSDIVSSISGGNIDRIAFARDKNLPGHINWDKCAVAVKEKGDSVDCVFDDICERALLRGATVVACHSSELPYGVSMVATNRKPIVPKTEKPFEPYTWMAYGHIPGSGQVSSRETTSTGSLSTIATLGPAF